MAYGGCGAGFAAVAGRRSLTGRLRGMGEGMTSTPSFSEEPPQDESQDHPVQDARGGSMAPGLVDDTGHQVAEVPAEADTDLEANGDR